MSCLLVYVAASCHIVKVIGVRFGVSTLFQRPRGVVARGPLPWDFRRFGESNLRVSYAEGWQLDGGRFRGRASCNDLYRGSSALVRTIKIEQLHDKHYVM